MKLTSFWMRLTHGFSGSLYWSVCAQAMLKPALKRAQWSLATERKTKHNSHNNDNKQQPNIPKPNRSLPIVCQKRNSIINIIITNRQEWPLDFQWFSPTKSKKAQGASDPSCSCRGCIRRAPPRRRPPLRRRRPHSPLPQAPSWPQVAMDPMAKCNGPSACTRVQLSNNWKYWRAPKELKSPTKNGSNLSSKSDQPARICASLPARQTFEPSRFLIHPQPKEVCSKWPASAKEELCQVKTRACSIETAVWWFSASAKRAGRHQQGEISVTGFWWLRHPFVKAQNLIDVYSLVDNRRRSAYQSREQTEPLRNHTSRGFAA